MNGRTDTAPKRSARPASSSTISSEKRQASADEPGNSTSSARKMRSRVPGGPARTRGASAGLRTVPRAAGKARLRSGRHADGSRARHRPRPGSTPNRHIATIDGGTAVDQQGDRARRSRKKQRLRPSAAGERVAAAEHPDRHAGHHASLVFSGQAGPGAWQRFDRALSADVGHKTPLGLPATWERPVPRIRPEPLGRYDGPQAAGMIVVGVEDSNLRPLAPEASALPG